MKTLYIPTESKIAVIRLNIDAGSAAEYKNWPYGIAHLLEHLMFRGTASGLDSGELNRKLAYLGADYNAYTSHNRVVFYISIPEENLIEASKLLKDMIFERNFNQEIVDEEKLIVLNEKNMREDDIDTIIYQELFKTICSGPMAIPVIGTNSSIDNITANKVQEFYEKHYVRSHMQLSITCKDEKAAKKVADIFDVKINCGNISRSFYQKSDYKLTKRKTIKGQTREPRLLISYRGVSSKSRDSLNLSFLSFFFSSGMDSRLFQKLRQEYGLCYGIGSSGIYYNEIGWFIISTYTDNVRLASKLIGDEIRKLIEDGITDEEMERARNKYLSSYYYQMETSMGRGSVVDTRAFFGLPSLEKALNRVKNMTKRQLLNTAQRIFDKENRQVFIFKPDKELFEEE